MCDVEGELRLRPLAERVAGRLKEVLRSQHCGLYLVDRPAKQLRSLTTPQVHTCRLYAGTCYRGHR